MQFSVRVLFLCLVVAFVSAKKQCTKGACCDTKTGLFKKKGSKCAKSSNECHVANATCSGFSASCTRANKKDGTKCSKGVCKRGTCVKVTSKKSKKSNKTSSKKSKKVTKKTTKKASNKKKDTKKNNKKAVKSTKKAVKKSTKKADKKEVKVAPVVKSETTSTTSTSTTSTTQSTSTVNNINVPSSGKTISPETKQESLRITSELEKAKTLLGSIQLTSKAQQEALSKVLSLIDECLTLQQTNDAAQLSVASSKIQASIQVAINKLNVASTGADPSTLALMKQALGELQKVSIRAKAQKKASAATAATDANAANDKAAKEVSDSQKVDALIQEGLPVITRQAIRAADKISYLQQRRIARLMAEAHIAEKREKARIIDQDLHRINKKAHAARKDALRLFAKAEANDEDAQEIKRAARQIVESDPEMKMRYFFGLTKELLASNREKFNRRYIKKVPLEETYSEHLDKEHTIIKRNEDALLNSNYFGDKYGRANITLPEISNESAPSLLKSFFTENENIGGIAPATLALFIIAGVLVVFIIFAIIAKFTSGKRKNDKNKNEVDDEDSYEKF